MERRLRTYLHKGKIRNKRKLPRKLKKQKNKEMSKISERQEAYHAELKRLHGNDWYDYVIYGG